MNRSKVSSRVEGGERGGTPIDQKTVLYEDLFIKKLEHKAF
jgi:hypothetical protein